MMCSWTLLSGLVGKSFVLRGYPTKTFQGQKRQDEFMLTYTSRRCIRRTHGFIPAASSSSLALVIVPLE
ncbi:hypothetical protein AcW1_000278 [Taiwanofungus camphoratus]|nr:hypothetical protein AcV5_004179 [Antrodia cinnamomea]KAI0963102.1 hypothetical protein AcW1_000278 [Antrodia cinnamomea]